MVTRSSMHWWRKGSINNVVPYDICDVEVLQFNAGWTSTHKLRHSNSALSGWRMATSQYLCMCKNHHVPNNVAKTYDVVVIVFHKIWSFHCKQLFAVSPCQRIANVSSTFSFRLLVCCGDRSWLHRITSLSGFSFIVLWHSFKYASITCRPHSNVQTIVSMCLGVRKKKHTLAQENEVKL